jgi:hypothetical protein
MMVDDRLGYERQMTNDKNSDGRNMIHRYSSTYYTGKQYCTVASTVLLYSSPTFIVSQKRKENCRVRAFVVA